MSRSFESVINSGGDSQKSMTGGCVSEQNLALLTTVHHIKPNTVTENTQLALFPLKSSVMY